MSSIPRASVEYPHRSPMPAAKATIAARNEFGRMTARRKRPAFSMRMRSRVSPFHGITLRKMPAEARSEAMCSGAATVMPPSLRKR